MKAWTDWMMALGDKLEHAGNPTSTTQTSPPTARSATPPPT